VVNMENLVCPYHVYRFECGGYGEFCIFMNGYAPIVGFHIVLESCLV